MNINFKILTFILFIGVIFEIISFITAVYIIIFSLLALNILSTIKKIYITHEIKSFKEKANNIYGIHISDYHRYFPRIESFLLEIENEYYLIFHNNEDFIEVNKINENQIIIDYSKNYSDDNINFFININELKNNKKIIKYYKNEKIEMYFKRYYGKSIPDFILKKIETVKPKINVPNNNIIKIRSSINFNIKEEIYNISKDQNDNSSKITVIFFDTETNGLSAYSSVLSISAAKCLVDYQNKTVKIIEKYERFYYPVEKYNPEAISINGLSQAVITEKRKGTKYSRHFKEDQQSFNEFAKGIDHFIAHNIEFDRKFLNISLKRQFCTMKSNTNIMKLRMVYGKHKWPKLEEAVKFYHVQSDNSKFHDSMYDVEMTIKVFEKMLTLDKTNKYIYDFLYKPMYHYINYDNVF